MNGRPANLSSTTSTGHTGGITLTTTPQLLVSAKHRRSVTFFNCGAVIAYYGHTNQMTATVGANAGIPAAADITAPLVDEDTTSAWYGVVASGTCDVRWEEVY